MHARNLPGCFDIINRSWSSKREPVVLCVNACDLNIVLVELHAARESYASRPELMLDLNQALVKKSMMLWSWGHGHVFVSLWIVIILIGKAMILCSIAHDTMIMSSWAHDAMFMSCWSWGHDAMIMGSWSCVILCHLIICLSYCQNIFFGAV